MKTKVCRTCSKRRPVDRFASRSKKDGTITLRSKCKDCASAAARARWEARKTDSTPRRCPCCKKTFPTKDFNRAYCRACFKKKQRENGYWNSDRRKAYAREHYLKKTYGITVEEYEAKLSAQGGGCALCPATEGNSKGFRLFIDHNHVTGEIREILCARCNFAVKGLADDADWGRRVIDYIERYHLVA